MTQKLAHITHKYPGPGEYQAQVIDNSKEKFVDPTEKQMD
jgi:hypothetical protein